MMDRRTADEMFLDTDLVTKKEEIMSRRRADYHL